MKHLLGIDIGLTKTKAAVFDVFGNCINISQEKTPLNGDEIDMNDLWNIVKICMENVWDSQISAISVSAHGNGLYAVDKEGKAFMPAISSMTTLPKNIKKGSWSGQTCTILEYLKNEESEQYKKIHKIMFCKDWIKFKLTGNITTDFTDMSAGGLMNVKSKLIPHVVKSTDCVGYYNNIPVSGGMFDVNACVIGAGLVESGRYSIISGTWGINSCITPNKIIDDNILQSCNFADGINYINIESAPTSSVNLEWFLKNILETDDYKDADKLAAKTATDIIYLPYIYGSTKNSKLSGAFLNLKANHKKAHMLRAVFEGVAMGHRLQLEQLRKAGLCYDKAILSGGASNSDVWCQIFADVLGLEIEVSTEKESGALGGAILGSIMIGVYPDFKSATKNMIKQGKKYYPSNIYEDKYHQFKEVIDKWILD